jgi:hypothetical protein
LPSSSFFIYEGFFCLKGFSPLILSETHVSQNVKKKLNVGYNIQLATGGTLMMNFL